MVGQTRRPNILVTGTPGTGKTSTCSLLASSTDYRHVNIGDLVKEKELHDGWDDEYECLILNEDKVKEVDKQYSHAPLCDELEDTMTAGGNVLDYHSCDLFPERWFDLVIVLQTETATLHDRLTSRLSQRVYCWHESEATYIMFKKWSELIHEPKPVVL